MPDLSLVFDLLARDKASEAFDSVGKAAGSAGKETEGFGHKLSGVWDIAKEAALPAGLAVGAAFFGAIEQGGSNTHLAAQLGLTPQQSAEAGKLAGDLFASNYGGSLDEVNDAIGAVQSSIANIGPITGQAMQTATRDALNFASAFGVDVAESTQIVGQLIANGLVPDASHGFDLMTAAYQKVPAAMRDELPDILNEYGTNFRALGFTGDQAFGLLTNAAQHGRFALDKTGDALKEFTIRGSDMSTASVAAYKTIGLNAQQMSDAIAKGGPTAQAALQKTAASIEAIRDPALRANTAIALFGTPLEDLSVDQIPAFLDSIAHVGPGLTDSAGAAGRLDATLSSGVGPALETMKRQATQAAVDGAGALIRGFTDGSTSAGGWQGTVQNLAAMLSGVLQPALAFVGGILRDDVAPAASTVFGFLASHQQTVLIVAGVIAGLMVPALIAWGVQSTIAGAKSAATWVAESLQASYAAVRQGVAIAAMVAGWLWHAGVAVVQGGIIAAVWTGRLVASAASAVISVGVSFATMVAGWIAQAAAAVLNGAIVVGAWVLMGAQALLQAARMAAAWFIALGPVGWVIAAVIGLVALIVANWDTVVSWTRAAWSWVVGAVTGAWEWIKGAVSAALGVLLSWFLNWTLPGLIISHWQAILSFAVNTWNGIVGAVRGAMYWVASIVQDGLGAVVSFFSGLPGKIGGFFSNMGSTLYGAGADLINGLLNGARSILSKIGSFFLQMVPDWIRGPFESALGISSPSKVFAAYGGNIGQGLINGLQAMRPAVASELAGLADTQAFGSLTATLGGSGGLGYTSPSYADGAAGGAGMGGNTYVTTVSGVASPEQVAAEVQRAQRTNEFLAGA